MAAGVFQKSIKSDQELHTAQSLPTFVGNQVKVIQAVTDAEHRYISTMSNPADSTCCGSNSSTLSNNQLRLHGQAVLSQSDFPDSVPSTQHAAVEAPPEVNSQSKGPEGLMGKTVQQIQAKKKKISDSMPKFACSPLA